MSTTKALPALSILFLFLTSSLILTCTEAARSLEESKADGRPYGVLVPSRNPAGRPSRGQPYTRPGCHQKYRNNCPPDAKP